MPQTATAQTADDSKGDHEQTIPASAYWTCLARGAAADAVIRQRLCSDRVRALPLR